MQATRDWASISLQSCRSRCPAESPGPGGPLVQPCSGHQVFEDQGSARLCHQSRRGCTGNIQSGSVNYDQNRGSEPFLKLILKCFDVAHLILKFGISWKYHPAPSYSPDTTGYICPHYICRTQCKSSDTTKELETRLLLNTSSISGAKMLFCYHCWCIYDLWECVLSFSFSLSVHVNRCVLHPM